MMVRDAKDSETYWDLAYSCGYVGTPGPGATPSWYWILTAERSCIRSCAGGVDSRRMLSGLAVVHDGVRRPAGRGSGVCQPSTRMQLAVPWRLGVGCRTASAHGGDEAREGAAHSVCRACSVRL
jgi:hypothetical protein